LEWHDEQGRELSGEVWLTRAVLKRFEEEQILFKGFLKGNEGIVGTCKFKKGIVVEFQA